MVIWWGLEIMILRETSFVTQMELYQNQAQWQELKNFYVARDEFERFVKGLPNRAALPDLDEKQEPQKEEGQVFSEMEMKNPLLGNVFSPSQNGLYTSRTS